MDGVSNVAFLTHVDVRRVPDVHGAHGECCFCMTSLFCHVEHKSLLLLFMFKSALTFSSPFLCCELFMCAGPILLITVKICLSLVGHFSYLSIHGLDKREFFSLIFVPFLFYQRIRHVIASSAGTHQHNYNHVGLGSPTRTPKNGKDHSSPHFSSHSFWDKCNLSVYHENNSHATKHCSVFHCHFFFPEMSGI